MYSERDEIILALFKQIEESILLLFQWNQDVRDANDYLLSPEGMKNLAASCMLIEAIGESVKKIDRRTDGQLLPLRPEIPWKLVMGMRDHIAHGYFDIDADVVFLTIKKHLAPLLEAVRFFIAYIPNQFC
jgi:uncharacterized protein with HEPN domain